MDRSFTFNIGQERLDEIKKIIKNPETVTNFINNAIDIRIKTIKTRYLSDFLYYLGLPFLAFLGCVGFVLMYPSLFFFMLMVVIGIYIVIFFFLFYNKYKGQRRKLWRKG